MSRFRIIICTLVVALSIITFFQFENISTMIAAKQFSAEYKSYVVESNELLKELKEMDHNDEQALESFKVKLEVSVARGNVTAAMLLSAYSDVSSCKLLDDALSKIENEAIIQSVLLTNNRKGLQPAFANKKCEKFHSKWTALGEKVLSSKSNAHNLISAKVENMKES